MNIDRALLADDTVSGHPGFSTSTLRLARADFLRYAEAVGHPPVLVDLPDKSEGTDSPPASPAKRVAGG